MLAKAPKLRITNISSVLREEPKHPAEDFGNQLLPSMLSSKHETRLMIQIGDLSYAEKLSDQ